jgi:hypothetical protein
MAFARPVKFLAPTAAAPPTAAGAGAAGSKLVSLKDLKKFRKSVNDKVENNKEDMSSVFSQLRSLNEAFDTLSQVRSGLSSCHTATFLFL